MEAAAGGLLLSRERLRPVELFAATPSVTGRRVLGRFAPAFLPGIYCIARGELRRPFHSAEPNTNHGPADFESARHFRRMARAGNWLAALHERFDIFGRALRDSRHRFFFVRSICREVPKIGNAGDKAVALAIEDCPVPDRVHAIQMGWRHGEVTAFASRCCISSCAHLARD